MDASQADKLRLNSLETFGQTKARKGEESSSEEPKKPQSSNDMIGFLRKKNAQKNEFHQQELDLKRQEMQKFQTLMANQQQQTYLCRNNNKLMLLFKKFWVGFYHHRTLQIKSGCVFTLWQ